MLSKILVDFLWNALRYSPEDSNFFVVYILQKQQREISLVIFAMLSVLHRKHKVDQVGFETSFLKTYCKSNGY
jgi:hypothetical protein